MGVKRFIKRLPPWLISALCLAMILWLTLAPAPIGEKQLPLFPGADKIVHGVMFGVFAASLCLDTTKWRGGVRKVHSLSFVICGFGASLTGIIIEFLQREMSLGRSFELGDIAADCIGSFIAVAVIILLLKLYGNKHLGVRL